MTALSLSDTQVARCQEGEVHRVWIVTAATVDSEDTIDVTALLQGRVVVGFQTWNRSDGVQATSIYNVSTDVITLDGAGGLTDNSYVIKLDLLKV